MDLERQKFKKVYKGYDFEFEEDYLIYRTVRRTLNSYFKNQSKRKIHILYNKLIMLSRVFPEQFLYHEIIISAPNMYTRNFFIYIINELFQKNYTLDICDDCWEEQCDELIKERKVKKLISQ